MALFGSRLTGAAMAVAVAALGAARAAPLAPPDPDAPNAPFVQISNGLVTAVLYLPDPDKGYYRATRFDWSGEIADLKVNGHSYFGRWFAKYDPKIHDAIMGPVQEFVTGQGAADAKPGGTYIKIGVGVLRKPMVPPERNFATLEIVDPGKWTTHVRGNSVEFIHEVKDEASGYGYIYRKTVTLPPGKAALVLEQHLELTGANPIDTEMYDHNFLVMDGQPSGPDFDVRYPFALTAASLRGPIEVHGNHLAYSKALSTGESLLTNLTGFGPSPSDYDIHVENRKTGAGVEITSDHPLSRAVFWSAPKVLAPEAYTHIHAERGKPMDWKTFYSFYALPPA